MKKEIISKILDKNKLHESWQFLLDSEFDMNFLYWIRELIYSLIARKFCINSWNLNSKAWRRSLFPRLVASQLKVCIVCCAFVSLDYVYSIFIHPVVHCVQMRLSRNNQNNQVGRDETTKPNQQITTPVSVQLKPAAANLTGLLHFQFVWPLNIQRLCCLFIASQSPCVAGQQCWTSNTQVTFIDWYLPIGVLKLKYQNFSRIFKEQKGWQFLCLL